ncbi:50S ribosomal protein L23 [Culicoidibacter larvae]|uniref:Large ribosomal subunit protein uL23 n=1 Tax=Culicoidibacter larvae TaxID=2579976 RepID=A0A5R8QHA4_9FIRM|nr:50S ribosomal protein L23 [Culicoidibacter larvae]TLG77419.1 50S ribosomal protein L23 [Culicoidibacter larvae]
MKSYADIIKRPIITEKTAYMNQLGKYVFEVAYGTNKVAVRQAVEALFPGVKVASVNIMNVKPKTKRVGRYTGKTNRSRKAIITLAADSKGIELF